MHRITRLHFAGFLLMVLSLAVLIVSVFLTGLDTGSAALAAQPHKKPSRSAKAKPAKPKGAAAVAKLYAEAIAAGDRVTAGQLDFACQFRMVSAVAPRPSTFPPTTDPAYTTCWEPLTELHRTAVESRDRGMDELWPGKGSLVFFREPLARYGASFFVMDLLALSPPAGGLTMEPLDSQPLPAASFRFRPDAPVLAVPAVLVRMRVTYKDPLTSPIAFAPGAYKWTNTVKRPRAAIKAVTVSWVVLSGLKRHGFPEDVAVVNLPVSEQAGKRVPFVTSTSEYVENSVAWWGPADAPGMLIAAVGRAVQFPEQRERIGLLNRVLIVDPYQPDALTALSRDLYRTLLTAAQAEHKIPVTDPELAERFNELFWDTYAQTTRMDIALGMEMGGLEKPTPADFLYRLIPAMERLAKVRPGDLENRLHLGVAYRWNNDQLAAINTHEAVLRETPPEHHALHARALIELAWSRIARVSWNRNFDDPGIRQAYKEAEEAFKFTDRPLDKFAAVYTMAYSLAFMPNRDNRAMLEHLTEAQAWYKDLPGASPASWQYLLGNDTLKGVLQADPIFQPLLASDGK